MCQCHQIGGPFIAEDPNCPEHGTEAQHRRDRKAELQEQADKATTVEELRGIISEMSALDD